MSARKPVGLLMGGYGFMLKKGPRRVVVWHAKTGQISRHKATLDVVNRYDLRIWAQGYLAARSI